MYTFTKLHDIGASLKSVSVLVLWNLSLTDRRREGQTDTRVNVLYRLYYDSITSHRNTSVSDLDRREEPYAGCVMCCFAGESLSRLYAVRGTSTLEKRVDRQIDGHKHQTEASRLPLWTRPG